jgi:hypothetical protein
MPTAHTRPNETREMRLFSKIILLSRMKVAAEAQSLPQFLARRRMPGEGWRGWDEIRYELRDVSGEIVSDGSIRKWAERYGIPENTQADGTDEQIQEYVDTLREAGIEL